MSCWKVRKTAFRAVFFDMDGTLIYPVQSGVVKVVEILRGLGLCFEKKEVEEAYRFAEEWFRVRVKTYSDRKREILVEYNRFLLEHLGIRNGLDDLAEEDQRRREAPSDKLYP